MKRNLLYNVLLCLLMLCSCIDEYNAQLPDSTQEMLVVEGNIYSDSITWIHLTHTIGFGEGEEENGFPVEADAKVVVKGSDGSLYEGKQTERGSYGISVGHLRADAKYWLEITTKDGLTFQSAPASPQSAPGLKLSYEQPVVDGQSGPVNIYVTTENTSDPQYICWNYQECYELQTPLKSEYTFNIDSLAIIPLPFPIDHGYGIRVNKDNLMANSEDYVGNRIDGFRLLSIPKTNPCLCKCYYIKASQEAITKAEYEYEEARRKQSDEMGGLFTPQPSRLPTNIHCTNGDKGVIGYIGVRGRVMMSEMYLRNGREVHYVEARKMRTLMSDEIKENGYTKESLFWDGFQVWSFDPTIDDSDVWASRWALDCRASGWGFTTFDKPDFWDPHF